jgi:hypothetical protein
MGEQIDDVELEVSRLPAPSAPSPSSTTARGGSTPAPAVSDAPDELSSASPAHPVSVGVRRPRTQRLARAGSAIALLTALIAAVLFLPTGNREALLHALSLPTASPTPTPRPGDDAFLWEHSVPWGQLLIDGKPGPDVSDSATRRSAEGGYVGAAFHLARGRHTLEYRASLFPPLTCTLTIPAARSDTCPLDTAEGSAYLTPGAPATRILDLQATVDRLPKAQARALAMAVQAALAEVAASLSTGSLAMGDHYVNSAGQVTQALTPLRIEPQLQLDASVTVSNGAPCATICTGGLVPIYTASEGWPVLTPVAVRWRYTHAGGDVIQDTGPASADGPPPILLLTLLARWQGNTWQPPTLQTDDTPGIYPVICSTGTHALDDLRATPGQTTVDQSFQIPFAAQTKELGCLYAGSTLDPVTSKSTGPIALVLYRAGALIAVNDEARRVFPTLPMASAHERVLAQAVAPSSL